MNDKEKLLTKALLSNDENKIREVFEIIYNEYVKLIAFYISKYINNNEVIKDITNEVFVAFYENCHNVKTSIKYYLLVIARNMICDYLKEKNNYILLEEVDILVDNTESHEMYDELVNELRSVLQEREVKIIIMHAVNGMTFKEIAKVFNINHKNANKIYERALKKFKKVRCL